MSLRKTPIAAALALCGAMPLVAQAAPTVSWSAPTYGATLSGTLSGSACGATTSSDAIQVTFWANDWQLNNDYSPPWNCNFPTTQLRDGTYTLRAVAYDAKGGISESRINVTVANNSASTSTPTPTPTASGTPAPSSGALDVWFKAPTAGSTISGVLNGGTNCYTNTSGSVSCNTTSPQASVAAATQLTVVATS